MRIGEIQKTGIKTHRFEINGRSLQIKNVSEKISAGTSKIFFNLN